MEIFTSTAAMAPAKGFIAITASDTVDVTPGPRGLLVTGAGNVNIMAADGTTSGVFAVTVGQIFPVFVKRVMAAGYTATVVGLA